MYPFHANNINIEPSLTNPISQQGMDACITDREAPAFLQIFCRAATSVAVAGAAEELI